MNHRMNKPTNEVTPIFPGWESWTFRPFLPDHSAAAWVLWVTPDTLLLAGHSRIKPSFPEVSCDLFTILKTPTKTGQYPHTASIPYTKASCTEFSQELRTVIYLIMLLPTDHQRTFLPSNVLTINASNTLCKKQFLTKKNLPGLRNSFNLKCPAMCVSLQADKKLLEVMISVFIQLKRKQTHLKLCKIILSWKNIHEGNIEI